MDTVQNVVSKYMERDVIYLLSQKLIVAALSAATSKRTFMIWGFILKNMLCAQERVENGKYEILDINVQIKLLFNAQEILLKA